MNVLQYYENALAEQGYKADVAQARAIERLQTLYDQWVAYESQSGSLFKRLLSKPEAPRGVYMWGGVGRGKSFLMDAFFETIPSKQKTRLHFHEFMRGVHQQLGEVKGLADPLDEVAKRVAKRYKLICFDEFHVSDIADAMILHRLLDRLFALGTTFVMTSNYEPSTLYPDGLHRDRILPAIALIKARMDILNVDAGVDYRLRDLEQVQAYLTPLNEETSAAMQANVDRLAMGAVHTHTSLTIQHRELPVHAVSDNLVWFDFKTLCGGPRSQNDYLELAGRFEFVLLSDVPRMQANQASEARRFTWLIDVFYDHKVKFIMSAECPAEELYRQGTMSNEFTRTVSRILEMQSKQYLESERRAIADF